MFRFVSFFFKKGVREQFLTSCFLLLAMPFTLIAQSETYYSYEQIVELENQLCKQYPTICQKQIIGYSVLNRPLVVIKVSKNVTKEENEPQIYFQSCIHGDEYAEQMSTRVLDYLVRNYGKDEKITAYIDNTEIYFCLMANPDGFIGHELGHRPNANGTDLNRNQGLMFSKEEYGQGLIPNSEPETIALRNFICSKNFSLLVDYHGGLQGIIYPLYYNGSPALDYAEMVYLAHDYSLGYPEGQFAETSAYDLYPTYGSVCEFSYGALGITSFAVELQDFSNMIFTDKQLAEMNRKGMFSFIEHLGRGVTGTITDAATGKPIYARVTVKNKKFKYTNQQGFYHKFLLPDTYEITVSANGYEDKIVESVVVNATASTVVNVQLTANQNYGVEKVVAFTYYSKQGFVSLEKAIGNPDDTYLALSDTCYAIFDMGASIQNRAGADFKLYGQPDNNQNSCEVFVASEIDGPWTSLGKAQGTSSFELGTVDKFRYVKLLDNGKGETTGFKVDAITYTPSFISAITTDKISESHFISTRLKNNLLDLSTLEGEYDILIVNSFGQQLFKGRGTRKVDFSSFPKGVYFLIINQPNNRICKKIMN